MVVWRDKKTAGRLVDRKVALTNEMKELRTVVQLAVWSVDRLECLWADSTDDQSVDNLEFW